MNSEQQTNAISNTSGVSPRGRAVLVKPYKVEKTSSGGIVLPDSTVKTDQMAEQRAVLVEAGPLAWNGEAFPRAVPGERILFSKWAGYSLKGPADGEEYRVVNDNDIFMVITKEQENG